MREKLYYYDNKWDIRWLTVTCYYLDIGTMCIYLFTQSLVADVMAKMEASMPTLEAVVAEVDQFTESEKTYADAPHVIDVILPLLCSYLPFWWSQGPDNVSPTGGWVLWFAADFCNALVYKHIVSLPCPRYLIRNTVFQKQIATVYYTFLIIYNS